MSKAKTAEDLRIELIEHIQRLAKYWSANPEPKTVLERCDGLAFSILNIFDGTTDLPAFDIVARPHPDDKEYDQSNGDDWVEDGTIINDDCMLHEMYFLALTVHDLTDPPLAEPVLLGDLAIPLPVAS